MNAACLMLVCSIFTQQDVPGVWKRDDGITYFVGADGNGYYIAGYSADDTSEIWHRLDLDVWKDRVEARVYFSRKSDEATVQKVDWKLSVEKDGSWRGKIRTWDGTSFKEEEHTFRHLLRRRLGVRIEQFRSNSPCGLTVQEVTEGSLAGKIGIKPGDWILCFAGKKVRSADELAEVKAAAPMKTTITIVEGATGRERELSIEFDPEVKPTERKLGVGLWESDSVWEVTEVVQGSIASKAGIKPGDQIFSLGGRVIFHHVALDQAVADAPQRTTIKIIDGKTSKTKEIEIEFDAVAVPLSSQELDDIWYAARALVEADKMILEDDVPGALGKLAACSAQKGRHSDRVAARIRALELRGEIQARAEETVGLFAKGDLAEARRCWESLLKLAPKHEIATKVIQLCDLGDRASVLEKKGDHKGIHELAQRAWKARSEGASAYAYALSGYLCRKASALDPRNGTYAFDGISSFFHAERWEEAREMLSEMDAKVKGPGDRTIVQLRTEFETALRLREECHELSKELDELQRQLGSPHYLENPAYKKLSERSMKKHEEYQYARQGFWFSWQ